MIEYVMFLVKPDGSIPQLGDNDSGRAFRLSEFNPSDRRSYLSSGAVIFSRNDFASVARKFYEESFWLLGVPALRKFDKLRLDEYPPSFKIFPNAGIAIFKNKTEKDADYLVFRGGATALRKNVSFSHNHADALSFELFSNGSTFFVDPGTYYYGKADTLRFLFRKTNIHNTITVDDEDSAPVTQFRFGLPYLPLSAINRYEEGEEYAVIDMQNSGYQKKGILHRRELLFHKAGLIIIRDEITGSGKHKISLNLNCGRNIAENIGSYITVSDPENSNRILVLFASDNQAVVNIHKSGVSNPSGYFSERYSVRKPADLIKYETISTMPVTFFTYIITQEMKFGILSGNPGSISDIFEMFIGKKIFEVIKIPNLKVREINK